MGALTTAGFLGVLLVRFESLIGMPPKVLYWLASIAIILAVYSFTCYGLKMKNWYRYLRFVAVANLLYCLLTLVLVVQRYSDLTTLGLVYFASEFLIIVSLACYELKVAAYSLS